MPNTFTDIRQSNTRVLQDQLNLTAVETMDLTLASINNELTMPARLIAAATPSLVVTVGSGTVVNPNTSKNRVIPFINNTYVAFTGGTITFPSMTGNITTSPGTTYPITIGANQFVAVLAQLDSTGNIDLVVGAAAGSLGAAVIPTGNSSFLGLGYIIVQSNGSSVIQNVTDAMIYQFAVGGGGAPGFTQATLTNNQSSPANITGFLVNNGAKGFSSEYLISRRYSGTTTPFTEDTAFYTNLGTGAFNSDVLAITVQSNNQVLVGGSFTSLGGTTRNHLVRLNTSGTIDTSFYTNLGTGFNLDVATVSVQSNQQILVGGMFTTFNGNTRNDLVRLNSDGTEDITFYTNLGAGAFNNEVFSLAIQTNGKIVVGGNFTSLGGNTRKFLVRLNADGTEDTAFYTNLGTGFNSYIDTVSIQSNGQILVGGTFSTFNGNTRNELVRLNADGTEDTAFYTNLGSSFNNFITSVSVQSNQKILVGGIFTSFNGNTRNRLVRLNSDGTEDTAFYTNLGTAFGSDITTTFVQSNQQILVGGAFSTFNGNTRNRLIRLNSDGTEDTTFYTNLGTGFNNPGFPPTFAVYSYSSNPLQILAGGNFTSFNGNTRNHLVRLDDAFTSGATELVSQGSIRGTYLPASTAWIVGGQNSLSPEGDTGVNFSMTSAGQMQYTTTNITGTLIESIIRFIITNL